MDNTMTQFFERQKAVVLARLAGKQYRKGTRHWEPPGKDKPSVERIFDLTKWDDELRGDVTNTLAALYKEVGQGMYDTFRIDAAFNVHSPHVAGALDRRVNKIVGINRTTESAIRDQLHAGEAAGESIGQLSARVSGVFDDASDWRATTIARTEVVGSSNEANHLAALDTDGVVTTKSWLATEDDRTRESHLDAEADNQGVPVNDAFIVAGNECDYPGDDSLPPEEVINCRCVATYSDSTAGEGGEDS